MVWNTVIYVLCVTHFNVQSKQILWKIVLDPVKMYRLRRVLAQKFLWRLILRIVGTPSKTFRDSLSTTTYTVRLVSSR